VIQAIRGRVENHDSNFAARQILLTGEVVNQGSHFCCATSLSIATTMAAASEFAMHARILFQKRIEGFAPFQIVYEGLEGHTSSKKYRQPISRSGKLRGSDFSGATIVRW
jgi:hypothetical protein